MAYVPVPKDLTRVKTKVAFNLTKRQLVCFGCGALIGEMCIRDSRYTDSRPMWYNQGTE